MFLSRKALKKTNEYSIDTINNLLQFSNKLIDTTISKLFQIKDVEELNITEQQKNVHRDIIINRSVKELMEYQDEIKSILKTAKSI